MKLATNEEVIKQYPFADQELTITNSRLILSKDTTTTLSDSVTTTKSREQKSRHYFLADISSIDVHFKSVATEKKSFEINGFGCWAAFLFFDGIILIILGGLFGGLAAPPFFAIMPGGMLFIVFSILLAVKSRKSSNVTQTEEERQTVLNVFTRQSKQPAITVSVEKDVYEDFCNIMPLILNLQAKQPTAKRK